MNELIKRLAKLSVDVKIANEELKKEIEIRK